MNRIVVAMYLLIAPFLHAVADDSPYAGQETRAISSLSQIEIASLQRGDGMGFAKLAELNSYPGPRHVLDMSQKLGLSADQERDTKCLFKEMQRNAIDIGEKIVAAEAQLDEAFENDTISAESMHRQLLHIGTLRAQLRYVHLEAHLRQRQLLTPEQIRHYDATRGYHDASH